MHREWNTSR